MAVSASTADMEEQQHLISPLSIDRGDEDDVEHNNNGEGDELLQDSPPTPLDIRVMEIVERGRKRSCYEIRPARLASELGISIDDACAELCGLLAAVGGGSDGATFRFESVEQQQQQQQQQVMVFSFPRDFKRRAIRKRRKQSMWKALQGTITVFIRALKIITAFGLILSLLILCVAAIIGLVAVVVAMARSGGGGHHDSHQRSAIVRQIRYLFYTMREMLWLYAIFGPSSDSDDDDGQDPYMREVAYDLSLIFSVCCGNPANLFFWMRARQLSRRRRRAFQGWGSRSVVPSEIDGVSLVRRGSWETNNEAAAAGGRSERDRRNTTTTTTSSPGGGSQMIEAHQHRGLLSVAVEFLFGPVPFNPGPVDADRWKLRAAVLVDLSSSPSSTTTHNKSGVSLREMSPYFDNPPSSLNDNARILEEGLVTVAHFNGIPSQAISSSSSSSSTLREHDTATFIFPELMAESSVVTCHYDGTNGFWEESDEQDGASWTSILCSTSEPTRNRRKSSESSSSSSSQLPKYLRECRYKLTKLSTKQFLQCSFLGFLNLIGVVWLKQSISRGGVLEIDTTTTTLGAFLHRGLLPVLRFYAVLFFTIPTVRFGFILVLNYRLRTRNNLRAKLSKELEGQAS